MTPREFSARADCQTQISIFLIFLNLVVSIVYCWCWLIILGMRLRWWLREIFLPRQIVKLRSSLVKIWLYCWCWLTTLNVAIRIGRTLAILIIEYWRVRTLKFWCHLQPVISGTLGYQGLFWNQRHAVPRSEPGSSSAGKECWRDLIERVWGLSIFQDQACQMNRITDLLSSSYGATAPIMVDNCQSLGWKGPLESKQESIYLDDKLLWHHVGSAPSNWWQCLCHFCSVLKTMLLIFERVKMRRREPWPGLMTEARPLWQWNLR